MTNQSAEEFRGYVERVNLRERINGYCAVGTSERGREVLVTNGQMYLGRDVLARWDIGKKTSQNGRPLANILISKVPEGIRPLDPQSYVMCAVWQDPSKQFPYLTMGEINRYYSPGSNARAFMFADGFTKRNGKWDLMGSHRVPVSGSISWFIGKSVMEAMSKTTFLLSQSRDELATRIIPKIRELGKLPILLESLHQV